MNQSLGMDVVLRQARVHATPAAVGRARAAPVAPAAAPAAVAIDARRLEAIEQARAEGWRIGYDEGRNQGLADGAAQASAALAAAVEAAVLEAIVPLEQRERQLSALLRSVREGADECLRAAEDEMVALCYETIVRVLGRACTTPAGVRAQLQALLAAGAASGIVALHVHPRDVEAMASGEDPVPLRWVPDSAVALGGCIVRSAHGALDARLETIFDEIKAALLAARTEQARGEA